MYVGISIPTILSISNPSSALPLSSEGCVFPALSKGRVRVGLPIVYYKAKEIAENKSLSAYSVKVTPM